MYLCKGLEEPLHNRQGKLYFLLVKSELANYVGDDYTSQLGNHLILIFIWLKKETGILNVFT